MLRLVVTRSIPLTSSERHSATTLCEHLAARKAVATASSGMVLPPFLTKVGTVLTTGWMLCSSRHPIRSRQLLPPFNRHRTHSESFPTLLLPCASPKVFSRPASVGLLFR